MKIFFSVGEPSGDLHGANLIAHLGRARARLEAVGYGGPKMAAAGCRLHYDLTELAVMFFGRVLLHLPTFWRLYRAAGRCFADPQQRPDAVVLIDYPGFNWWIARAAQRHKIPVFYYGVPQLWAWGGWRVKKMRRLVDHVLCKLPFEQQWFEARGCRATYVGHPYFDQLAAQSVDDTFLARQAEDRRPLVAILPGSRSQEVAGQLNDLLAAAERVRAAVPDVRFAIASYNSRQALTARQAVAERGIDADVYAGKTAELIRASHCCLACSGSVSLELMYFNRPTAILYRLGGFMFWLARKLIQVRYITLVNLLASKDPFAHAGQVWDPDDPQAEQIPFPEYPTPHDCSQQLAQHVIDWLTDAEHYDRCRRQLRELSDKYGAPGASQRAAAYMLEALSDKHAGRRAA